MYNMNVARFSGRKVVLSPTCHTNFVINNLMIKGSQMKTQKDYYVYTHTIAGKIAPFYVGKANELRVKLVHRKHNPIHTRIIKKYGKENIIVKTMLCRDEQHAFNLEVKMIAALRNGGVNLVNFTDGGEGTSGWIMPEDQRIKRSFLSRRENLSSETRKKLSLSKTGVIFSEETKKKIGLAHKGKTVSLETRKKQSEARKMLTNTEEHKRKFAELFPTGRKLSEEQKRKISEGGKGLKRTEETKKNISKALKGRVFSEEHRKNIGLSSKGRVCTEETRRKISEANKKRYADKPAKSKIDDFRIEIITMLNDGYMQSKIADVLGLEKSNLNWWIKSRKIMEIKKT